MAADHPAGYRAFLLRLWRADNDGQPVWRLTLEEAGTRQQHHFHGVDALQAFLANLTAAHDQAGTAGPLPRRSAGTPKEDRP